MWDEQLKLPIPPLETVAPAGISFWATAVFSALALIGFLYGLKHWRDTGRPIIVLMMVGGALTVFVEPYLDIMGGAWHPEIDQNTAFTLMGRMIPWWVVAVYTFYFGALASWNYLAFQNGATTKKIWLWFMIPVVVDIVMEEIMMHYGLYYYYGNQSLILFAKFPLWWATGNSMGEFIGVSALLLMIPFLRGWKLLLIPLVMPIADMVGYGLVCLPSFIAVQTEGLPWWAIQASGLMTWALTLGMVHGLALLLASDSPYRLEIVRKACAPAAPLPATRQAMA